MPCLPLVLPTISHHRFEHSMLCISCLLSTSYARSCCAFTYAHMIQTLLHVSTPQELSNELCGSPERGAAALLAAFEAGGAQAQSAVAIMLGGGSCLNPASINAALSAFGTLPELNDPGLVLR